MGALVRLPEYLCAAMSESEKTYHKEENPFGLEEGELPTLEDVARLIRDGKAKRIVIMVRRSRAEPAEAAAWSGANEYRRCCRLERASARLLGCKQTMLRRVSVCGRRS